MSNLPPDFDPTEEQEIYEIFGSLRREVYDVIQNLASQILSTIDKRQADDERLGQPELTSMLESSLVNIFNVVTKLGQDDPDPRAESTRDDTNTDPEDPNE